jgi:DNA-binding MarR family transcriptional regulator
MARKEARKDEFPRLENQLCFQLYLASKSVVQAYQPFLEPLGLTYPQYLVLLVLWAHEEISVKDLGEQLHLDSGTLSPLLKRLQTKGIIVKERDAEDERSVLVKVTAEGKALKTKIRCIPGDVFESLGMKRAELESLFKALNVLNLNLESANQNTDN